MSGARLRSLRGRRVSLVLRDGTRIDDCALVSGGHSPTGTVWLVANGADMLLPREELVAVWPVSGSRTPSESLGHGSCT